MQWVKNGPIETLETSKHFKDFPLHFNDFHTNIKGRFYINNLFFFVYLHCMVNAGDEGIL